MTGAEQPGEPGERWVIDVPKGADPRQRLAMMMLVESFDWPVNVRSEGSEEVDPIDVLEKSIEIYGSDSYGVFANNIVREIKSSARGTGAGSVDCRTGA